MRWRAFEGGCGCWYVAFEGSDGSHTRPEFYRGMTRAEAEREATARNLAPEPCFCGDDCEEETES